MWIQIDKCLMKADENIILGLSYISPIQSKYYNDEEILNLEREITSVCSQHKYVLITGDLNARTARLKDYTRVDNFLSDLIDFDGETLSFFDKTPILEKYNVPLERATKDCKTNNTGNWLLETCKNNNLFIVNGRIGRDKHIGAPTFRDKSVIDYTISTADCFTWLSDFEVIELDPIFWDGLALISWSLGAQNTDKSYAPNLDDAQNRNTKYKWSDTSKENFIQQIDLNEVLHIKANIDEIESNYENLNFYTNKILSLLEKTARITLNPVNKIWNKRPFDKPWFGPACKSARKEYNKGKRMYNSNKNEWYKSNCIHKVKTLKKL